MSGLPENSAISTVAKRHAKEGVTPDLVKQIMELPADTPDSTKVNNEEWLKKHQDWQNDGGTAQPDPAIVAYAEWQSTVEVVDNAFERLGSFPSRENPRRRIIKFVPAGGGERFIDSWTAEMRRRRKRYPFYLLNKDDEAIGMALLSELPGCLTTESKCRLCQKPRFNSEGQLVAWLRENVLEKLLTGEMELDRIGWQGSHERCYQMNGWEGRHEDARMDLATKQKQAKKTTQDATAELMELNKQWNRKGHAMVGYLRATGQATREEADRLRARIDKITNTKTKQNQTKRGR